MPWVASGSTIFPSWYHRTCMSSSTNEAMHWNGRLSPWKTIWCWDGVIWKEGSSRGASKTERKTLVSHRWLLCAKADINEIWEQFLCSSCTSNGYKSPKSTNGRPEPRLKVFYSRITSLLVEESVSISKRTGNQWLWAFFSNQSCVLLSLIKTLDYYKQCNFTITD